MATFRITCGACGAAHEASSQAELRAFQSLHNAQHGRVVEFQVSRDRREDDRGRDARADQRQAG